VDYVLRVDALIELFRQSGLCGWCARELGVLPGCETSGLTIQESNSIVVNYAIWQGFAGPPGRRRAAFSGSSSKGYRQMNSSQAALINYDGKALASKELLDVLNLDCPC
jgi:hypothetical protein